MGEGAAPGAGAGDGRVWVVGSLNVDRAWQVARHPRVGETIGGSARPPAPGGKGLNQAVAAARAGADVVLVGRVGDDEDGRWLAAVAAAEGIDVSRIAVDRDRPTGAALVVVAADGSNTVTVDAGANAALAVDADAPDGPLAGLAPGDVVVAQLEVPVAAVAAAFAAARAAGACTVLNPSPLVDGASLALDADVVVVNELEAASLAGGEPEPAASADDAMARARSFAGDGQLVVVTRGAEGLVATGPDGDRVIDGVPVSPVDTTGAGDCFLGVLAAGLAEQRRLRDVLERANRAAAISATTAGTVASMPTAAEIDDGPLGLR
jgi:ribokinase